MHAVGNDQAPAGTLAVAPFTGKAASSPAPATRRLDRRLKILSHPALLVEHQEGGMGRAVGPAVEQDGAPADSRDVGASMSSSVRGVERSSLWIFPFLRVSPPKPGESDDLRPADTPSRTHSRQRIPRRGQHRTLPGQRDRPQPLPQRG